MKISNNVLLAMIAAALIGIFAVLAMDANKKTPAEKVGDSISNAIDNAADSVDQAR